MIYIFRWLFGYVKFTFKKGFCEDFLTDCFLQGIELRDVKSTDGFITAVCNLKNYKKLHRVAFKHGGVVKIVKKKGLPFVLLPLKNRMGFFVGIVCFCVIISFLNSFIWNVEIQGNVRVSTPTINAYLENNNLKQGVMWGSIDRDELAWNMMSDFEDFSWVHINKIGTTARVEINEASPVPKGDNDKLQGINVFRKELSVTVSREQKTVSLKGTKNYYDALFFTADIPLYLNHQAGDQSQKSYEYLTFKDVKLPIGYKKTEERFFISTSRTMTDSEIKALAEKRLSFAQEKEFDGFEIVNKTEKFDMDEAKCTLTASYVIRRK